MPARSCCRTVSPLVFFTVIHLVSGGERTIAGVRCALVQHADLKSRKCVAAQSGID
jgi:hypothetical protein